jgi:hypothetical protein
VAHPGRLYEFAESGLRRSISLVGCLTVPPSCFLVVQLDALALGINVSASVAPQHRHLCFGLISSGLTTSATSGVASSAFALPSDDEQKTDQKANSEYADGNGDARPGTEPQSCSSRVAQFSAALFTFS